MTTSVVAGESSSCKVISINIWSTVNSMLRSSWKNDNVKIECENGNVEIECEKMAMLKFDLSQIGQLDLSPSQVKLISLQHKL